MSTLRKCNFTNLDNGYKCGCLRCVLKSTPDDDNDSCKGCGHHQSFHYEGDKDILQSLNNLEKINEALFNALKYSQYNRHMVSVIPGQNYFEPHDENVHSSVPAQNGQSNNTTIPIFDIHDQHNFENCFEPPVHQLDETIRTPIPAHFRLHIDQQSIQPNHLAVQNQSPTHLAEQNFVPRPFPVNFMPNPMPNPMQNPMLPVQQNLGQSHPIHNVEGSSSNVAPFANEKFELICLVGGLIIPKKCAKLEEAGLKKTIQFHNDSNGQIKQAIEKKLFPYLEDKNWIFYKCKSSKLVPANVSIVECRFKDLKEISGSRNKLYIGTEDGPIIMALK
ncbi:hypothetical protein RclHR1_02320003 [Rhizophagus clarus]|uniref:Uncharacterized protein n=1 Tax=Rhizophagus clarus TaxID=94130 RepID=A0A2Z6RQ98_9GLOM|nr:hypothetical protein RclHR1_02320003 [Rhizophagus clarus]GES85874.1 hypothetical protein GLOIN_2v1767939 [Rhizophagus clarus]